MGKEPKVEDFAPVRKPNVFNQILSGFCDPNKEVKDSDDDDEVLQQQQCPYDATSKSRSIIPAKDKKVSAKKEKHAAVDRKVQPEESQKGTRSLKQKKATTRSLQSSATTDEKTWKPPITSKKTTALLVVLAMMLASVLVLSLVWATVFFRSADHDDSSLAKSTEIITGALSIARKGVMQNLEWARTLNFMAIGNSIMTRIHAPTPISPTDVNGLDFPSIVDNMNLVGGGLFGNVKIYSVGIYLDEKGLSQVKEKDAFDESFFRNLVHSNSPKGLVIKFHRKTKRKGFESALQKNMQGQLQKQSGDSSKNSYEKFASLLSSLLPPVQIPKNSELFFVCSKKNTMTATSSQGTFTVKDKHVCPSFFNIYLGQSASARPIKHCFLRAALAKS